MSKIHDHVKSLIPPPTQDSQLWKTLLLTVRTAKTLRLEKQTYKIISMSKRHC